jgi:hypothetical protein
MQITMSTMRRGLGAVALSVAGLIIMGCHDLTNQPLPAGTFDPTTVNNAAGARGMAVIARAQFQFALVNYIPLSGLLTDEFQANARGTASSNGAFPDQYVAVDARFLPQGAKGPLATDALYATLQQLRGLNNQAIGALKKYDADSSAALRGELYAQEGYAELWLADLYCSGVPLSTLDFQQDFTYKPSSTTDAVYQHAIALFDTALTLATDSASILNFAKLGKARVQLALGQYAAAAQTVDDVPADFRYVLTIQTCGNFSMAACNVPGIVQAIFALAPVGSMSDGEGGVGLLYRSSRDLRTAVQDPAVGTVNGNEVWLPVKYPFGWLAEFVVASGIDAELIRAEADLHAGGSDWLTMLNDLRTGGTYTSIDTLVVSINTAVTPPDTTFRYDTAWVAGAGGVDYLGPLQDPGNADARLRLLFRERAFWLYATGARQGDLRRLVRQYHLDKNSLYPSGAYPGIGSYGNNIDAPIPMSGGYSESSNPYFHGCLSRD